jgi:methyl-accepting chemotaxis protein
LIEADNKKPAAFKPTGQTSLVGSDFLMRSRSRFERESTVLKTQVDTPSVRAALENTTGMQPILDYRGVPVLSAYAPLSWHGVTWAVLAEIDQQEVEAPIVALVWRVVIIGSLCSAAAFVLGFLLGDSERADARRSEKITLGGPQS